MVGHKAMRLASELVDAANETSRLAHTAVEQRNVFAAAFIHACDDEGTYFGLEPLYQMAKMVVTKEAEEFIGKVSRTERGY
jgi:hypothetical protein